MKEGNKTKQKNEQVERGDIEEKDQNKNETWLLFFVPSLFRNHQLSLVYQVSD